MSTGESAVSAAVYLRQSLDVSGEGKAIARQREDCRALADARGWRVVDEYVDNSISASRTAVRRPAYERLVRDFEAGRFGALVVHDLDRLTRQPRQLEDWIDAATDRGLLLTTANGEADLTTDAGRLFARIKASVARAEVERKGARQRRAAVQRAQDGRPPKGVRLTGYTVAGAVRDEEAVVIRELFARFLAGESLRSLAVWASAGPVAPRRAGSWTPSTVRTILANPRYAGLAVYCGRVTGQRGVWSPIVDEEVWRAVQDKLEDPRRKSNRTGTDRRYLGSGLYLCGVCDQPVRSHTGSRYRCPEGGHVMKLAASVDEFVTSVIVERLSRPDVADLLSPPADGVSEALRARVKALRARLATIESDYDADRIDGRRFQVATEKVTAELQSVEQEQARRASSSALAALAVGPAPGEAFRAAPLGVRREILAALLTVRLDQGVRGQHFDPATVRITWIGGDR